MTISQAMIGRTIKFESRVLYMYLDTAGKVTVGTGHMIGSATTAAKLKFTLVSNGQPATAAQIKAEHALMLQQTSGKPASYYKKFRTMEMALADADDVLEDDLGRSETDLKAVFTGYGEFPAAAQEALIDMMFNLGRTKFLLFVDLIAACKKSDWATAAAESHRQGIGQARNDEIRELFESAVTAPAVAFPRAVRPRPADVPRRDAKRPALRPEGIERRAAELMQEAIAGLSALAGSGSQASVLFPDGVQNVDLTLTEGETTVNLRVTGSPRQAAPGPLPSLTPLGAGARPGESCREVFRQALVDDLHIGDMVPNKSEALASGAIKKKIKRTDPEFTTLVSNTNADIVFKDEEGTGADRMMTTQLRDALARLAAATKAEWSGVKVRVTEAWDENDEHAGQSLHYEGRAADLTTAPIDPAKLGRLARLAVNGGFDWVWYENSAHIHVSVKA